MRKPKVMAAFTLWHKDFEAEAHARATMSLEERMGTQLLELTKELREVKAELKLAKDAGWDPEAAEAELQRMLEEEQAKEREKRIALMKEKAMRRIGKRDLSKGWGAWFEAQGVPALAAVVNRDEDKLKTMNDQEEALVKRFMWTKIDAKVYDAEQRRTMAEMRFAQRRQERVVL